MTIFLFIVKTLKNISQINKIINSFSTKRLNQISIIIQIITKIISQQKLTCSSKMIANLLGMVQKLIVQAHKLQIDKLNPQNFSQFSKQMANIVEKLENFQKQLVIVKSNNEKLTKQRCLVSMLFKMIKDGKKIQAHIQLSQTYKQFRQLVQFYKTYGRQIEKFAADLGMQQKQNYNFYKALAQLIQHDGTQRNKILSDQNDSQYSKISLEYSRISQKQVKGIKVIQKLMIQQANSVNHEQKIGKIEQQFDLPAGLLLPLNEHLHKLSNSHFETPQIISKLNTKITNQENSINQLKIQVTKYKQSILTLKQQQNIYMNQIKNLKNQIQKMNQRRR